MAQPKKSEQLFQMADQTLCSQLVELLPALLTPDSQTIKAATDTFKDLSKNPSFIPSLTRIITCKETDENSRKLAAVLFRKRVVKQWKTLEPGLKDIVRTASLEFLVEVDEKVYKHLAEVVAGLAEHELKGEWQDLWNVINGFTGSDNYEARLRGTELLKCVCQTSVETIFENNLIIPVLNLIETLLAAPDVASPHASSDKGLNVHKNIIDAFNAVSVYFDDGQKDQVRRLLPRMVQVAHELVQWDDDVGSDAMSMFTTLCETEDVKLVNQKVAIAMSKVCYQVATNEEGKRDPVYEEETRANALAQLQMLIKYRKHAFAHDQALLSSIATSMISLVRSEEDPDDGIMSGGDGDRTVYTAALQVLDQLAMNVPAESIFALCMPQVSVLCGSTQPLEQRAGLLILSVIVEGCADLIMATAMEELVPSVVRYLKSDSPKVRSAAYFTIGQFAEHLVPDIADYANIIMPELQMIVAKDSNCEEFQNRDVITKVYYALESFIESLGSKPNGMANYSQGLMLSLGKTLNSQPSLFIQECVVGTIGAIASATEKKFSPFLAETMGLMTTCGCFPSKEDVEAQEVKMAEAEESGADMPEDRTILWSRSLQTLSSICRAVGDVEFSEYAQKTLDLAIALSTSTEDPDIRGASFSLFGALAAIMKDQIGEVKYNDTDETYMEMIASILMEALQDSVLNLDGCADGDENRVQDVASMLELSRDYGTGDGDEVDALDMENLNFETGPIEAKIAAMETVGELAEVCPMAFGPYFQTVYDEAIKIKELEGIIHEEIMRASLCCAMIMSAELFKLCKETTQDEGTAAALDMAKDVWPSVLETIRTTNERQVCMSLLYHLEKSIQACGTEMFQDQTVLQQVCEVVLLVLQDKAACQVVDEDMPLQDGEADQAEHDQLLIEYACDILPTTCVAIGGEAFSNLCWKHFYPVLKKRALNKKAGTTRAAALGAMADIMKSAQAESQNAGETLAASLADELVPIYLNCLSNKENNVRNNAIYGLGLIVSLGISKMNEEKLLSIMTTLWSVFQKEKADNVKDQVLGASARLIIAIGANNENFPRLPVPNLLETLSTSLPVKTDPSELGPVALCFEKYFSDLTQPQVGAVLSNVCSMSSDFGSVLDDGTKLAIVRLMTKIQENDKFGLLKQLTQEQQGYISEACCLSP